MIAFDQAVEALRRAARPLGTEPVAIGEAAGRVLAAPVVARIGSPRADVSTMDGYAVPAATDGQAPVRLRIAGESFPGRGWSGAIGPAECVRIFTGAPVPKGADRVVIQEQARRDGDTAIIEASAGAPRYIRRQGSDFEAGAILLPAGQLLDARALVAAAAGDTGTVELFRRPRVHILSTGDELVEPGEAAEDGEAIPDSVSLGLAAMVSQWGGLVTGRTRLPDSLPSLERAASAAVEGADLILVSGGASVGERDFAKAMFQPSGLDLVFAAVAIKPGKPAWFGNVADTLVLGLPGNPTSALVTARLFLAPLLSGLSGRTFESALPWRREVLDCALAACGGRETFHRGRMVGGKVGILPNQDSGAQHALVDADLLVRQPADCPGIPAGGTVDVLEFT